MLARTIVLAIGLTMAAPLSANAAERFHPVEQMCIWYQTDGQMMKGQSVRCHRKFGLEWFEIQEMEIGMAGIKQKQNSHNIGIRDKLYAIDRVSKTGTESINPMFAPMQQAISRNGSRGVIPIWRRFCAANSILQIMLRAHLARPLFGCHLRILVASIGRRGSGAVPWRSMLYRSVRI